MHYNFSCLLLFFFISAYSQTFYLGNDLSYVNQMEDCGAVFKEKGQVKDVYQIFADHGTNLVRVRLWYLPTWQNGLSQPAGVKSQYSNFDDVKETIARSKAAGMQVMLDLQLTDFWADPVKQHIPSPWLGVATNTAVLADSVYNYTMKVLTLLNNDNLMPEIVKVGNENNGGILRHTILNGDYTVSGSVSSDWARHAQLYNSAIKAIRDISKITTIKPKIALHYAGISGLSSWCQRVIDNGITDFDIIGFSYYYAWHKNSIAVLGNTIRSLKTSFPAYDVMVVETGYIWSTQNFDALGNIITTPDPLYLPVIPEKQLEYMVDYSREVKRAGGSGVIFWEPAWVSTPCRTPWGVGSSHDHVVFFDPVNTNFMENGGGRWTEPGYYNDVTTKKVTVKLDMTGQNVSKGVFITGKITGEPQKIIRMASEGSNIFSYFTYVAVGDSGNFYFLNDSILTARETVPLSCALWNGTDRKYKIGQTDIIYSYKWASCEPASPSVKFNATFQVDMTGQSVANGVWITGAMTGASWKIIQMTSQGNNIYSYTTQLASGDSGAYYFLNDDVWVSREAVPSGCRIWWDKDRGYKMDYKDTLFAFKWGSCETIGVGISKIGATESKDIVVYPNPSNGRVTINIKNADIRSIELFSNTQRLCFQKEINIRENKIELDLNNYSTGIYYLKAWGLSKPVFQKILIY